MFAIRQPASRAVNFFLLALQATLASVGLANNVDAYRLRGFRQTTTELWEEFGDVPMNPETECIEVAWCGFPKGTHREDIWHWFEETFGVAVHDLMYS